MAFNNVPAPAENNEPKENKFANYTYTVEVERATPSKDNKDVTYFDAIINGLSVKGLMFIFYKTMEGKEGTMISFPSNSYTKRNGQKGYSNIVWFPASAALVADVEKQIQAIFDKKSAS